MKIEIRFLSLDDIDQIIPLTQQLNTDRPEMILRKRQTEMFQFNNYTCFGFYVNEMLVGVSSGWITVKLYSGKQLEIDNVIVDQQHRSKGYGAIFIDAIEQWAKENQFETVELNAYVKNSRGHKFYFTKGYGIIGFHFLKEI